MARSWLRVVWVDAVILSGWLACAGMAVLHERGYLWGGSGSATAVLSAPEEANEQWFGLYYRGEKIGFSHVMVMPEEREGIPGIAVVDQGRLAFNLLGQEQTLEIGARAFIDANWRLRAFHASVRSPTSDLEWSGRREGDALVVRVVTPTSTVSRRVRDPSGSAFVNGLSSWAAFHRLQVGQSGKAWMLNPLALHPEPVYFHVRRVERVDGREALVVESEAGGMMTTSWVTPQGEVLRESSPLGWELRRQSREQALARLRGDRR